MFQPVEHRALSWIALQGTVDQMCAAESTKVFVTQVQGARVVMLPGVGHGFGVTRRWLPELREAVAQLAAAPPVDRPATDVAVRDLPLVEVPVRAEARRTLVVMISGDGGWASLDREISDVLADSGLAVVGLNALQYFWKGRTPEATAGDLERILRHFFGFGPPISCLRSTGQATWRWDRSCGRYPGRRCFASMVRERRAPRAQPRFLPTAQRCR